MGCLPHWGREGVTLAISTSVKKLEEISTEQKFSYNDWQRMGFSQGFFILHEKNAEGSKPFTLNKHVRGSDWIRGKMAIEKKDCFILRVRFHHFLKIENHQNPYCAWKESHNTLKGDPLTKINNFSKRILAKFCLYKKCWWETMIAKTTVERDAFGIAKFISDYKTAEQRRQEGKSLREKIPRESHAEWEMASDRTHLIHITGTHCGDATFNSPVCIDRSGTSTIKCFHWYFHDIQINHQ